MNQLKLLVVVGAGFVLGIVSNFAFAQPGGSAPQSTRARFAAPAATSGVTTATSPLVVTGSNVACTGAGALSGGCVTRSEQSLMIDAGVILAGNLIPSPNNAHSLGTDTYRWADIRSYELHIAGGLTMASANPNLITGSTGGYFAFAEASGFELVPAASGRVRLVGPTYIDGNEQNAARRGAITLSAGTGTATVNASAICVCTDTAATPVILRCNVSGTTLTASEASGTSTHVIAYLCQ